MCIYIHECDPSSKYALVVTATPYKKSSWSLYATIDDIRRLLSHAHIVEMLFHRALVSRYNEHGCARMYIIYTYNCIYRDLK